MCSVDHATTYHITDSYCLKDFDNNEKEEESSPTPCIEYDAAKTLRFRCMGFIAQQMLAVRFCF